MVNPHVRTLHECRTYHEGRGDAKRPCRCPRHQPASFHRRSGGKRDLRHSPHTRCDMVHARRHNLGHDWRVLDVAWHQSIGRDTFWTPAHLAIQLCGALGGLTSGFLILSTTFGRSSAALQRRAASVKILGLSRTAWSLHCYVGGLPPCTPPLPSTTDYNAYGLDRHHPQSASRIADEWVVRHDIGALDSDRWFNEPVPRRFASEVPSAISLRRRDHRHARLLPHHRIHCKRRPAQCDCLSCGLIGGPSCIGGRGACLGTPVGKHHYRRHLHSCCLGPAVDSSPLCRPTETRAGLSKCDSLHSNGVSAVAHSTRAGARPAVAEQPQAWKPSLRLRRPALVFLVSFVCLSVALRELPNVAVVAGIAYFAGTHYYFSYDDTAGFIYDPYKFQASENTRTPVLDRHDPCFDSCDSHHAPGVHLGQLDKTGSTIKR